MSQLSRIGVPKFVALDSLKPRFTKVDLGHPDELPQLAEIYNSAWFDEPRLRRSGFTEAEIERARALCISEGLLQTQHLRFPAGQIVGRVTLGDTEVPASLLSTVVHPIRSFREIKDSYAGVTSERTFSLHVSPDHLLPGQVGMLFCVSIAVHPDFQSVDLVSATLHMGLELAELHKLVAAPFSAPRGFGAFLKKHPGVPIQEYLEWTRPVELVSGSYLGRLDHFNQRKLTHSTYTRPLNLLPDDISKPEQAKERGREAYLRFKTLHGAWFRDNYGRELTVVDYVRLTGRRHIDPVLDIHIQNGADFIYDNGQITCIFPNSRPEDVQAAGYNIVMVYHPLILPGV